MDVVVSEIWPNNLKVAKSLEKVGWLSWKFWRLANLGIEAYRDLWFKMGKTFRPPEFLSHWNTIFNRKVLQAYDSILKQIPQTYRAVLFELFESCPNLGSNCPSRLVGRCYQSTCLFWNFSKKWVYSYWEICNYFIYFFKVRRENKFLTFYWKPTVISGLCSW